MKSTFFSFVCLFTPIVSYAQILVSGPNAPDVEIQFTSNEFQFQLSNSTTSNNFQEFYLEYDTGIDPLALDLFWRFQGYIIYQVIDNSVSIFETTDANYVRIAAIVDLSDTITTIPYTSYNPINGCSSHSLVTTNTGIPSSISVSNDAFTGQPFVQDQSYCFRVYAFATNFYNMHQSCNSPDQLLLGYLSGQGVPLVTHCELASESLSVLENESLSLLCYPNPVSELLVIKDAFQTATEITITDTEGRKIAEFNTLEKDSFDFSNYAPGYYFLHAKQGSGDLIKSEKIIVTH
jgi:hypothetical protein